MIGAKNLPDKALSDTLFGPYLTVVVVFIALFTLSVFLNAYSTNIVSEKISLLRLDSSSELVNHMEPMYIRIRTLTLVSSVVVIIASEIARSKYKIEV